MATKTAAQKAFEASQRAARGRHSLATITAKGITPSGSNSLLGNTPTPGTYGKGLTGPPVPAVQPFDPAFEAQKLGAQWNASVANSEAKYQTGQTAYRTGYNQDGSVNAANPYSQAQLLQDSYKRSQAGTLNGYAAQGQLYSGARQNAVARDDRNYAQGSDQLRQGALDTYHGIGVGQLQSYGQNALGVSGADYDALRRALYGS